MAGELFATADDPMGALRWALAQVRRSLGDPDSFRGDPVEANLGPEIHIDALHLDQLKVGMADLPGQLLEGVDAAWSAEFDAWISVERWRAESQVVGAIRTATMLALSRRDSGLASSFAMELVSRAPLEEASHVLLIRALVASGNSKAANERAAACEELFLRELGVEPGDAVRNALRAEATGPPHGVSLTASALTLLEAGSTAFDAGAIDAGIEYLRRAVIDAEASNDRQLYGHIQCVLGTALVHGIRGYDAGSLFLHGAIQSAFHASDPATAATALMELGHVESKSGRRNEAGAFFEQAEDAACDLPELRSGILTYKGINLSDWGRFDEALEVLGESSGFAERFGNPRDRSWAMTFRARALIDLGRHDEAREWLLRALPLALEERWLTFRPLVELFLLDLDRLQGRDATAIRSDLEMVFARCCQLSDPCWEGLAARGIGLTYADAADTDTAYSWFDDAAARCTRVTDTWVWVEACVLDSEIGLATKHGHLDRARQKSRRLLRHAASKQLDHYVNRAQGYLDGL